jgi:hypothetical protein
MHTARAQQKVRKSCHSDARGTVAGRLLLVSPAVNTVLPPLRRLGRLVPKPIPFLALADSGTGGVLVAGHFSPPWIMDDPSSVASGVFRGVARNLPEVRF